MNSGVNYIFGNVPATGYAVTQAADPKISWETTTITNLALDFGIFNNSLSGSIEFFQKEDQGYSSFCQPTVTSRKSNRSHA